MKESILHIEGMTCRSCERRIEAALGKVAGVESAKASQVGGRATIRHDGGVVTEALRAAVEGAGYTVKEGPSRATPIALGIGIGLAAIYFVANSLGLFNSFPIADSSIGYGMLIVIGLLTSVHCVAMCGGLAISQSVKTIPATPAASKAKALDRLLPGLLYNGGRVISYTIVGAIVGGLGAAFSFSETTKGAITALAGLFMLWLGLKMMGILPALPEAPGLLPKPLKRGIATIASKLGGSGKGPARGPFVVGILGGLMPCGPLQTMQLYALGTGSIAAGALSMFLFSIGTVPLMLLFGAAATVLPRKFMPIMIKASAVLVLFLGTLTLGRAAALAGIALPDPFGSSNLSGLQASLASSPLAQNAVYASGQAGGGQASGGELQLPTEGAAGAGGAPGSGGASATQVAGNGGEIPRATIENGVQTVVTVFGSNNYMPFYVQAGIPVRWIIRIKKEDITGCNRTVIVPAYRIRKDLKPGDNIIEFTPTKAGIVPYSCWMGMIRSAFGVVDDLGKIKSSLEGPAAGGSQGGQGDGGTATASTASLDLSPPTSGDTPVQAAAGGGSGSGNGALAGGPADLAAALAIPQTQGGAAAGGCGCGGGASAGASGAGLDLSTIGLAKIRKGVQEITVKVDANGYSPAAIVLQKGLKAIIHFEPVQLDGCNSVVFFPELNGALDLTQGQLSTPPFTVTGDFTFNCSMNMLHGYVKTVADLSKVKTADIRKELASYRPGAADTDGF
ncbi:MAG TPA: sulfite exporter TauE/SafE family protein [Rectinemataceae bacterium]|nr:sulfite exporter TauE/SafE family protein [Rectinemataceae bacterium]